MSSSKKRKASKSKASSSITVSIKVQEPDPSVDPIVVSFPGGVAENAKFAWRALKEKRPKNGRIVVGSNEACLFQSQNQGRGHDGRRTKTCVGILDKNTKTLTIHQAAQRGTVYALTQSVPSYNDKQQDSESQKLSAVERRRVLFESFGSAKKQRVLKSQQANVVDSLVEGSMEALLPALQKNSSESNQKAMQRAKEGTKTDAVEAAYAEARKNFLPSFDLEAKQPRLVYDARDMAGDDVWGHFSRVVDACVHKSEDQNNWIHAVTSRGKWAPVVKTLLEETISPTSTHAKYQVKCAMLLNQLIKFHYKVRQKPRFGGTTEELQSYLQTSSIWDTDRFLQLFCTPVLSDHSKQDSYACSKQDLDKCRVYMLLLYVMAQDCKASNIVPIAQELRLEVNEAANLLRAAGCTVSKKSTQVWSAVLTVPLTFPPPKRGRGKS